MCSRFFPDGQPIPRLLAVVAEEYKTFYPPLFWAQHVSNMSPTKSVRIDVFPVDNMQFRGISIRCVRFVWICEVFCR